jgi:hypothetical protein
VLKCSDRVAFLTPILRQFHKNLDRYVEVQGDGDVPHFYNERATLGLLAAAFWQEKWIALEEYATQKNVEGVYSPGRADLWAREGSSDLAIAIEAKQYWSEAKDKDTIARRRLVAAANDAIRNEDAKIRAAVSFLVPCLATGTPPSEIDDCFRELYGIALKHGADALALWSPKDWARFPSPMRVGNGESRIWPGLLTVVRVVDDDTTVPDYGRLPIATPFPALEW